MKIPAEIENNHRRFVANWTKMATDNWNALAKKEHFLESYYRIGAVNSLRVDVVERAFSAEASLFFKEAHHDLLISHIDAATGSWRSALQSLRSFLENSLNCLYFADHPVELRKWQEGKFRIEPKDVRAYFCSHPDIADKKIAEPIQAKLKAEYASLSKAVHGSATSFRMTEFGAQGLMWSTQQAKLGSWLAHEKTCIEIVATLIGYLQPSFLSGAKLAGTRQALASAFSKKFSDIIKEECAIVIKA